jgi:hypothetical protein
LGKLKGYEFKVVTERTIRRQPRLDNIKLLIYYQRTPVHPQHQILCSEFLHGRKDARLDEMMDFFETRGVEKGVVYALLRWGVVGFHIDMPLIPEAHVYLPGSAVSERRVA